MGSVGRLNLGFLTVTAACLTLLVSAASAVGAQTFWRDKDQARPEPARITLEGGSAVLRMNELRPWSRWGEDRTNATGMYRYNTCRPSCAEGNYNWTGVDVQLRKPHHRCHGQRRYSVIEWDPDKRGWPSTTAQVNCDGKIVRVS
jgi:opacity protein-like surface antigen